VNKSEPYLDWITGQEARIKNLVLKWSRVNTHSLNREGLNTLIGSIGAEFSNLGGQLEMLDLPDYSIVDGRGEITKYPLGKALRVIKRPNTLNGVFLGIHYDTVYRPEEGLELGIRGENGNLMGPGVADAKGGLAVLILALEALERTPWANDLGWEVVINPDEEIGSPGSASLLREAAKRNRLGLIFEPTLPDGSMVDSRKGSGNFTAVVRGRASHAGRAPSLGRNAINALAELIVDLNCFAESADTLTLNIGGIEGGGALNVVPDLAIARFNVRVGAPEDMVAVENKLCELEDSYKSKDGLSLKFHGGFARPPKLVDPDTLRLIDMVTNVGEELGIRFSWRHSGGASDGNILAASGLPTVDTMGPRGANIHSNREYLILDSLIERARLAAMILMKISTNGGLW
jgi:glutamate carboxypeptidase